MERGRARQQRGAALLEVGREPSLRRLTIAWGAFFVTEWTMFVALGVWAFEDGGAKAVGLIGLCRLLPGAVLLPFASWLADRFSRHRLVTVIFAAQALLVAALVVAVSTGSTPVVYVLVAAASVVAAPERPAHLALVPLVARSPQQLVAANVAAGVIEGVATLVGPILAGALLLFGGPWAVLLAALGASVGGFVAMLGVRPISDPAAAADFAPEPPMKALFGGVRAIGEPDIAVIILCFALQLLVRGMLMVLLVVVSFELLDLGQSGVGWLSAALGVGGVVGVVFTFGLTGRRRLAMPMAIGLALWGAPIAIIGISGQVVVALALLAVVGVGNLVMDVAGLTLLQRLCDDRTLGRLFGALFAIGTAMAGLGAAVTPVIVDRLGLRWTLVVVGSILPLAAVLAAPWVRRIDARSEPPGPQLEAIAALDLLCGLPPTTLEKLAARAEVVEVPAGEWVVREGEPGDRFYVVMDGTLEVTQRGGHLRHLVRGDHFGEIALMRRVPRTASVRAVDDVRLVALSGAVFVDAVTGHSVAFATASTRIDDRLATDPSPRVPPQGELA